jgi:hypothetical protein
MTILIVRLTNLEGLFSHARILADWRVIAG